MGFFHSFFSGKKRNQDSDIRKAITDLYSADTEKKRVYSSFRDELLILYREDPTEASDYIDLLKRHGKQYTHGENNTRIEFRHLIRLPEEATEYGAPIDVRILVRIRGGFVAYQSLAFSDEFGSSALSVFEFYRYYGGWEKCGEWNRLNEGEEDIFFDKAEIISPDRSYKMKYSHDAEVSDKIIIQRV
jgi:hypothetical protein